MRKLYVGSLCLLSAVLMMIGLCLFDSAQHPHGDAARSMRDARLAFESLDAARPTQPERDAASGDEGSTRLAGNATPTVAAVVGPAFVEVIDLTQDEQPMAAEATTMQVEPPLASVVVGQPMDATTTDTTTASAQPDEQEAAEDGEEAADSGSESIQTGAEPVCPVECITPVDVTTVPAYWSQIEAIKAAKVAMAVKAAKAAKAAKLMQMRKAMKAKKYRQAAEKPCTVPASAAEQACPAKEADSPCEADEADLPCKVQTGPGCLTSPPADETTEEGECEGASDDNQPGAQDESTDEVCPEESEDRCPEESGDRCPQESSYPRGSYCPSHGGCTRGCPYSPGCMRFYPTVPVTPETPDTPDMTDMTARHARPTCHRRSGLVNPSVLIVASPHRAEW
jgi:hypothetical protein